jgi:hypothetical protein
MTKKSAYGAPKTKVHSPGRQKTGPDSVLRDRTGGGQKQTPAVKKSLVSLHMQNGVSGGGIKHHVQQQHMAGAAKARIVSPAQVSQIGLMQGDHAEGALSGGSQTTNRKHQALYQGSFKQVELGNQCALRVGRGGPGADRTVYRAGTQSPVNPNPQMSATRDTLAEFGPESSRPRNGSR